MGGRVRSRLGPVVETWFSRFPLIGEARTPRSETAIAHSAVATNPPSLLANPPSSLASIAPSSVATNARSSGLLKNPVLGVGAMEDYAAVDTKPVPGL